MAAHLAAIAGGALLGLLIGAAALWFTIEIQDGSPKGRKQWGIE